MTDFFTPKMRPFLEDYKKQSYVKEDEESAEVVVDCALGVNPFGCSPLVSGFLKNCDGAISRYPAYPYVSLRQAISNYWKDITAVGISEIRIGGGSVSILDFLCKCMIDPGDRVLGFVPQFTDFSASLKSFGGVYDVFPLNAARDYELDVEAFCAEVTSEHKIVYVDNPNNPTGQVLEPEAIAKLASRCRECGALLIVDEAYGDYLDKQASALTVFPEYENLCVVRSFSKGFGLAGVRVGYAFMHEPLAGCYDKAGYPFTVSTIGAALAEQVLSDNTFLKSSRDAIARIKGEVLLSLKCLRHARTHPEVPICTLLAGRDISLYAMLGRHGVLSEAGEDFANLGKHAVRLRVPAETEPLISILCKVEQELI
jgi:histidinol-phosphate aminotransferase